MMDHPQAENAVPEPWRTGDDLSVTNESARFLKRLIILKIMRPDRIVLAAEQFCSKVLGSEVTEPSQVDLAEFTGEGCNPKSPLLLVSAPGYDASYKVDILAKQ